MTYVLITSYYVTARWTKQPFSTALSEDCDLLRLAKAPAPAEPFKTARVLHSLLLKELYYWYGTPDGCPVPAGARDFEAYTDMAQVFKRQLMALGARLYAGSELTSEEAAFRERMQWMRLQLPVSKAFYRARYDMFGFSDAPQYQGAMAKVFKRVLNETVHADGRSACAGIFVDDGHSVYDRDLGKNDLDLACDHIPGVENDLSDGLSRYVRHKDQSDWQYRRDEFLAVLSCLGHSLWTGGGADPVGTNAQVPRYCSVVDSFLDRDLAGEQVYANPDFELIREYLRHFLRCQRGSRHAGHDLPASVQDVLGYIAIAMEVQPFRLDSSTVRSYLSGVTAWHFELREALAELMVMLQTFGCLRAGAVRCLRVYFDLYWEGRVLCIRWRKPPVPTDPHVLVVHNDEELSPHIQAGSLVFDKNADAWKPKRFYIPNSVPAMGVQPV
ncbi:hypothetical protein CYMTET_42095 [Cymbomonas tetramitiformis]|uniref:Uncharacterized protein n=1 Tax=Cymbomonas tetramitiformis TaxID=36881 RepID=A0AAE0C4T7_9CHLO|nr:hypothetical protein CYMTET_42095 [Cymbomonas tetramitiformis]